MMLDPADRRHDLLAYLEQVNKIGCPVRLHCCRPIVFGWGGVVEVQMCNMQIRLYKFVPYRDCN